MTLVYGCFGCGGEEDPARTCTIIYQAENGRPKMHWLCRPCVTRFGPGKIRSGLTRQDMHPNAQPESGGCSPYRQAKPQPCTE